MPLTGVLRSWNDDRGFGFIAPTHGGREIFVHVSAFPRDGTRPAVGEHVSFELGRGANGQPQAISVVRLAVGAKPPHTTRSPPARQPRPALRTVLAGALAIAIAAAALHVTQRTRPASAPQALQSSETVREPEASAEVFRCDGRTHCSQMTSCAEAKFFLRHCPNVQMDGDHDGVPCEQQWCTSPFAR